MYGNIIYDNVTLVSKGQESIDFARGGFELNSLLNSSLIHFREGIF